MDKYFKDSFNKWTSLTLKNKFNFSFFQVVKLRKREIIHSWVGLCQDTKQWNNSALPSPEGGGVESTLYYRKTFRKYEGNTL